MTFHVVETRTEAPYCWTALQGRSDPFKVDDGLVQRLLDDRTDASDAADGLRMACSMRLTLTLRSSWPGVVSHLAKTSSRSHGLLDRLRVSPLRTLDAIAPPRSPTRETVATWRCRFTGSRGAWDRRRSARPPSRAGEPQALFVQPAGELLLGGEGHQVPRDGHRPRRDDPETRWRPVPQLSSVATPSQTHTASSGPLWRQLTLAVPSAKRDARPSLTVRLKRVRPSFW